MAETTDALRLAELLATRLCHDLSSPLNTLVGVADVARDDPTMAAEAMTLMAEAGQSLAGRLRFCRAAWGGPAAIGVGEFTRLVSILASKRLTIDLGHLNPAPDFSANGARLALNMLLLAVEALPRGGIVALHGDPGGDLVLRIEGPEAAWPAGFMGMLANPAAAWAALAEPSRLQAPLSALLAQAGGIAVSVMMGGAPTPAPALVLRLG